MPARSSVKRAGGILAAILMCSTALGTSISTPRQQEQIVFQNVGFADTVEAVRPAVVGIRARHWESPRDEILGVRHWDSPGAKRGPGALHPSGGYVVSEGAGFFISPDGYVVTNNHVTEGSNTVEILTAEPKRYTARVVAADAASDLALLKVDAPNVFPFVEFSAKSPRVGEWIFAVGNPFGLDGTVTAGIVSAQDRQVGNNFDEDMIQIDAPINRGNSGGPSFDITGKVIGVNTMIFSPSGGSVGIGFAIPAETVQFVVTQMKERGSVPRGWLGARTQSVTPAIADILGLAHAQGALVAEPVADGPAAACGIAAGDIIVSFNGTPVKNRHHLATMLTAAMPGTVVSLGVVHDGRERIIGVRLAQIPAKMEPAVAVATHSEVPPASSDLGILMVAGTENNGLSHGVVVVGIDPGGRGAELGLAPGDVILDIGGTVVRTPDEVGNVLTAVTAAGRRGALLHVKSGDTVRFVAVPADLD